MKRNRWNVLVCVFVAVGLVLSPLGSGLPLEANDVSSHWAEEVINEWSYRGLASGYPDGSFRPDQTITRAEFITLVNKAFHFTDKAPVAFSDVAENDWFYDEIAAAVAAGYISGYPDGTMRPNHPISRQEAAILLGEIRDLEDSLESAAVFADQDEIPDWSIGRIGAVVKAGFMSGYPDGRFLPVRSITRAEALVAMDAAVETRMWFIREPETFGPGEGMDVFDGNVVILADGASLQNTTITGDLIIDEAVGEGDVTLINVTVQGDTFINGGGADSIHIYGGDYRNIIIQKAGGRLRIVMIHDRGASVIVAEKARDTEIFFEGVFDSVKVNTGHVQLTFQGETMVNDLEIAEQSEEVVVTTSKDTVVVRMTVNATTDVTNEGRIISAEGEASSDSTYLINLPENMQETPTRPRRNSGSSTVSVSAITVTGEADTTTITTDAGTLQMIDTVTPTNASNKEVTWSVTPGTGLATIDSNGLLTAVANGTVVVVATAQDGSGVTGSLQITISGQNSTVVRSSNDLWNALDSSNVSKIIFGNDIEYQGLGGSTSTNAYVDGQIIDGNGFTLKIGQLNINADNVKIKDLTVIGDVVIASGVNNFTAQGTNFDHLTISEGFASGSGTFDDPWIIKTAGQLNNVRKYLGAENQHRYFELANDIDLGESPWNEGEGWEPIGSWPDQFHGRFDGNNKIISGLTIDRPVERYIGLFGRIEGATIKDLTLTNFDVSGEADVGSLVGYNNSGTIKNVIATGEVNGSLINIGGLIGYNYNRYNDSMVNNSHAEVILNARTSNNVGGLVGGSNWGRITNSSAQGNIIGKDNVGGLLGYGQGYTSISKSYFNGSVEGNDYVGGLAGFQQLSRDNNPISDSYSTGRVDGNQHVGGLVGSLQSDSHIARSYAAGLVIGNVDTGGLVGSTSGSQIVASFWDADVTNQSSSADSDSENGKTTSEMTQKSTFTGAGWDFDTIWNIDQGNTYPYLQWQGSENIPYPPRPFAGGSGTETDPYQVATAEQLNNVRDYLDAYFIQTTDIDLGNAPWNEGAGWEVIGTLSTQFEGSYDGNGHSISNLYINTNSSNIGLFGSISPTASISNLEMIDVDVTGTEFVGGLVGRSHGNIDNCSVTGQVTGSMSIGGIIGWAREGQISNSSADSNLYRITDLTGSRFGVLVGDNEAASITNSYALGTIKAYSSAGGLVGYNRSGGSINNSYANVDITCIGQQVGGLIGNNSGTINQSYSIGAVDGATYIGGLTGYNTGAIYESYAIGNADGSSDYVGGFAGYNYGTIQDSYAMVNVSGIQSVGGFVGVNSFSSSIGTGTIINAYSTGTVTGASSYGGLVGYKANQSIVTNSYWDKEASSISSSAAGTGYQTSQMIKTINSVPIYTDWDFINTWSIEEGQSYPYLQWQGNEHIPYPLSSFAGGSGTEEDPYQIATAAHLNNVREYLGENKYFELKNDIDLGTYLDDGGAEYNDGKGWLPIGETDSEFMGIFNGNGFAIGNLIINRPEEDNLGLFGYVGSNAVIKEVTLEVVRIEGGNYLGSLVGYNKGSIENSHATGSVIGTKNYVGGLVGQMYPGSTVKNASADVEVSGVQYIGGLIGYTINAVIINSYATGDVNGTANRVGGLVGHLVGSNSGITNSYATGEVRGNGAVGGLVGVSSSWAKIASSYATGNVIGADNNIGGLVGESSQSDIIDSYATGSVTGINNVGGLVGHNGHQASIKNTYAIGEVAGTMSKVGGLVGINHATVENSYWDTETSNQDESDGGTGKETADMKNINTYTTDPSDWDFDGIWKINGTDNAGYPFLRWQ